MTPYYLATDDQKGKASISPICSAGRQRTADLVSQSARVWSALSVAGLKSRNLVLCHLSLPALLALRGTEDRSIDTKALYANKPSDPSIVVKSAEDLILISHNCIKQSRDGAISAD